MQFKQLSFNFTPASPRYITYFIVIVIVIAIAIVIVIFFIVIVIWMI